MYDLVEKKNWGFLFREIQWHELDSIKLEDCQECFDFVYKGTVVACDARNTLKKWEAIIMWLIDRIFFIFRVCSHF